MSRAKQMYVQERVSDLKKILVNRSVTLCNRIRMLILIKNNEGESLSKQKLGNLLGVSSSSIQIWRRLYETGGLGLLLSDNRIGYKPSILSETEHEIIQAKLNDPVIHTGGMTLNALQ